MLCPGCRFPRVIFHFSKDIMFSIMKKSVLSCMAVAVFVSPVVPAQTFFSLHAGSDGVGVDVSNVSPYYPVMIAPAPRPHVHVPLMPGYVPDYGSARKHYRKAAKEYRKAARHYRKAVAESYPLYAVPYGGIVYGYDDDDMEDFYEDYYKHIKKHMKKQAKRHKKEREHYMKHYKKHHKKHHKHHADD